MEIRRRAKLRSLGEIDKLNRDKAAPAKSFDETLEAGYDKVQ